MTMNHHKQNHINRRDVLKITALMGGLAAGGGLLKSLLMPRPVTVSRQRYLMGTIINLTLIAENRHVAQEAARVVFAHMEEQIHIFDPRQAQGPLARLNRQGRLDHPPRALVTLLRQALAIGTLTAGAFDVTIKPLLDAYQRGESDIAALLHLVDHRQVEVADERIEFGIPGMQVTLDGIAKGRVVDAGVEVLKMFGFDRVLVEAGGDLFAQGRNDQERNWKIAVEHPRPKAEPSWLATFDVHNAAVATSGDYRKPFTSEHRLHHILNPRSGLSNTGLASATVIAPDTTQADAFATALMVMGLEKGLAFIEQQDRVECLLVTKELSIHRSSDFPSF